MERATSLACWGAQTVDIKRTSELQEELELGEGRTNENFIAFFEGRRLFVRIGSDLPAYGVTRVREQAASRCAAAEGFGPAVVHTESDALVCEFLPGRTLKEADLSAACTNDKHAPLLQLVVSTLRKMHASPVPPELLLAARPGWAPADVHSWLALAESKGFSRLPFMRDAHALIEKLEEAAGPTNSTAAFCHFDPLPDKSASPLTYTRARAAHHMIALAPSPLSTSTQILLKPCAVQLCS